MPLMQMCYPIPCSTTPPSRPRAGAHAAPAENRHTPLASSRVPSGLGCVELLRVPTNSGLALQSRSEISFAATALVHASGHRLRHCPILHEKPEAQNGTESALRAASLGVKEAPTSQEAGEAMLEKTRGRFAVNL